MLEHAKRWARAIKRDVAALYIAGRDRRTPWYAKAIAVAVAAYALSPIDLIPDFIPVLGYLDDLVIVPIGILIAVRLMPGELMAEFRDTAARHGHLPSNWLAAAIIVAAWVIGLAAVAWWAHHQF
jgi:uncharacterized membrane protein YkvA (DUF1232 family)